MSISNLMLIFLLYSLALLADILFVISIDPIEDLLHNFRHQSLLDVPLYV